MRTAGGTDCAEAAKNVVVREVEGMRFHSLRRDCFGA